MSNDLIMPGVTQAIPGILFLIVPIVASPIIAAARGVHPFPALLLGLFGSWMGLAIVMAFYRPSIIDGARHGTDDPMTKLQTLEQLRDEGLVDEEEFEERRREVLEKL